MLDGEPPPAVPAGVHRARRHRAEPAGPRRQHGPGGRGPGHVPRHDLPQDPRVRNCRLGQLTLGHRRSRWYWFKVRTEVSGDRRTDALSPLTRDALSSGSESMTTVDATARESGRPAVAEEAPAAPALVGPLAGDPSIRSLASFIAGSVGLGLRLVGL